MATCRDREGIFEVLSVTNKIVRSNRVEPKTNWLAEAAQRGIDRRKMLENEQRLLATPYDRCAMGLQKEVASLFPYPLRERDEAPIAVERLLVI